MASRDFNATAAPQDVVAALSLTAGTRYTAQNVDTIATLRIRQAAAAPAPTDRAHKVESGGQFVIEPQAGQGIWVWTDEAGGCAVIVTEAP